MHERRQHKLPLVMSQLCNTLKGIVKISKVDKLLNCLWKEVEMFFFTKALVVTEELLA